MSLDDYLAATELIPVGETRTFLELAALAGRPGAARAAGRALAVCPASSSRPWHRVVAAGGGLARDPARARIQLERLRGEGARPGEGESVRAWAARVGTPLVAHIGQRVTVASDDGRIDRWSGLRVEAVPGFESARARGLHPSSTEPPESLPERSRPEWPTTLSDRLATLDWPALRDELSHHGVIHLPGVLSPAECGRLIAGPHDVERHVDMAPKGYGIGEYDYWPEPPPPMVDALRRQLYELLLPAADALFVGWFGDGQAPAFEPTLDAFHERCRAAGQTKGSSILLRYREGGVNHLHRDLYGDVWFPYQALVVLGRRDLDFEGGDFLLVEERDEGDVRRPVGADRGDVVIFAVVGRVERVDGRAVRVGLRHGMAPLTAGERRAAGVVFHLKR